MLDSLRETLLAAADASFRSGSNFIQILEHLNFSEEHNHLYQAFRVSKSDSENGFTIAGKSNKAATADYLLDRRRQGKGVGAFAALITRKKM